MCVARKKKKGRHACSPYAEGKMIYDSKKHHRRSIRLKGHDYSGSGLYFVTICAHQEFRAFANGTPFSVGATCVSEEKEKRATCVSPVRQIIEEEWLRCGVVRDDVFPDEFVVMPDHFHGLIRIADGKSSLGHVVGAFKAAVSRRIRRGDTHVALKTHVAQLPEDVRIWHRDYYEIIVRDKEIEKNIREYIKMNPWKCVVEFEIGAVGATRMSPSTCVSREEGTTCVSPVRMRGIGNPALWNLEKLGVLCSRNAPKLDRIPKADVYFGGFHSPMEKEILARLLELKMPVIYCPAWGIEGATGTTCVSQEEEPTCVSPVRKALEENRMLILEMDNKDGDLLAAKQRNEFVVSNSDKLWVPYVSKGGMLDKLIKENKWQ